MKRNKWIVAVGILIALALLSYVVAGIATLFIGDFTNLASGNVAIIPVKGVIATARNPQFLGQQFSSSSDIVEAIEKAEKQTNIKAIVLEIDSSGGTPVGTDEVSLAIKNSDKLTVAWIREIGASGAYWIASSADIVVANRMSLVGSIGALGSYIQFSGLMDKYGVSYERLVAGKYKDIGSPFRNMTAEEKVLLQAQVDQLQKIFLEELRENRKLSNETLVKLSEGMFFLGMDAKELGLVDVLGGKEEVLRIISVNLNITPEPVEVKRRETLSDLLSRMLGEASYYLGSGISQSFLVRV